MLKVTLSHLNFHTWRSIKYENWNYNREFNIEGKITQEILDQINAQIKLNTAWEGCEPNHQVFLSYKEYEKDVEMDWLRSTNQLL